MIMRRREFIAGLGAAAWPLGAGAQQQPALPVIGLLSSVPFDTLSRRCCGRRSACCGPGPSTLEAQALTANQRPLPTHPPGRYHSRDVA
jgi:hypothetical protein